MHGLFSNPRTHLLKNLVGGFLLPMSDYSYSIAHVAMAVKPLKNNARC